MFVALTELNNVQCSWHIYSVAGMRLGTRAQAHGGFKMPLNHGETEGLGLNAKHIIVVGNISLFSVFMNKINFQKELGGVESFPKLCSLKGLCQLVPMRSRVH